MLKDTEYLNKRLYTPGPAEVPFPVLKEIIQHRTYHRSDEFKSLYKKLISQLKDILQTSYHISVLTSSGTGAMEAAIVNFCNKIDKIVYLNQGIFGRRWGSICKSFSLDPREVKIRTGNVVRSIDDIDFDILGVSVFLLTHVETSTGSVTDLKTLIQDIKTETDALIIVDAVSSVASIEFYMDKWGIDVAITASQKSLMNPPGLSIIAYNERAKNKMYNNGGGRFYFDLRKEFESFTKFSLTAWTPSIGLWYGLDKACSMILDETLENRWSRTRDTANFFREEAVRIGFKLFSQCPSDSVTALSVPDGVSSTELIKRLNQNHDMVISDGQDDLKGKIIRVSHMGNYKLEDFKLLIDALDIELKALMHICPR